MFFSRVTSRFINHPRVHSSIWFSITMLIPSAQLSDDSRVSRQRQRNFTEFRITCMIGIFVEIFRDKSNAFVNYRIYDLPYRDINYTKLNESCSSADIIFFTGIHRWHATTRITFRRFNSEETQHTRPSPRFSFLFSFFLSIVSPRSSPVYPLVTIFPSFALPLLFSLTLQRLVIMRYTLVHWLSLTIVTECRGFATTLRSVVVEFLNNIIKWGEN